MSIFKEFREFAIKGNVIDLAVGVIIGTAFSKVVTSVFFLVRVINRIKRTEEKKEAKIEEVKAEIAPDILLLQEIRDLLKTKPTTK